MTTVHSAKAALLLVSLGAFAYQMTTVQGYAKGAPTEVCEDMTPQHGVGPKTTPSPYTLSVNQKSVKPGGNLVLSLSAKDGTKFKGFMMQARDEVTHNPIGTFMPVPTATGLKEFKNKVLALHCSKGAGGNNTITHNNPTEKGRLVMAWHAPADLKNSFKFRYTVAKNGGEFWVGVESGIITVDK
ncbi:putative defense protein Hdd11 [Adelges cooleyi]|uniref:putative defense protein Hdd11 n=1 Tax=Adelges cooleyi TaxID=133065 RepID=UPI00217FD989|nr:putative defense protein Hdd11 [Adelges cooleyi]